MPGNRARMLTIIILVFFRYVFTPYMVIIWAVSNIRVKNMEDPAVPQEIKDYILSILILSSLTLVGRLALVAYRMIRQPL